MADQPDKLAGTQRAAILLMSLGEQDAANDPAFHSLIFNCKKLRLGLLGVTVKDVTPDGMFGQYQT